MANRNDFPGLLSDLRDFDWSNFGADTGGQSTSDMPMAMMPGAAAPQPVAYCSTGTAAYPDG